MQDEGQALDNSWGYLAIRNLKESLALARYQDQAYRTSWPRELRWIPALDRENSFRSRWLSEKPIDAWSLSDSGALDESDLREAWRADAGEGPRPQRGTFVPDGFLAPRLSRELIDHDLCQGLNRYW